MTAARTNLVSFAGAGLIWIVGFQLGVGMGPPLAGAVSAYVVAGTLFVTWQHAALGRALAVLWLVAVVTLWVLVSGLDPETGLLVAAYAAFVYGSASFAAWAGSALLLRTAAAASRRTICPGVASSPLGWISPRRR